MNSESASSTNVGMPSLGGSLGEACTVWRDCCLDCNDPAEKKDGLRSQSRTFFACRTRNGIEEDLAKLIKELGPPLTSEKFQSRICALAILCGAIEGCQAFTLSNSIVKLLGTFILGQCGPIVGEGSVDDYDEQVRDAAVVGLTSLVKCRRSKNKDETKNLEELKESIKMRVDFAQKGVEHRCASAQNDEVGYDHGLESAGQNGTQGGLSLLPRSRRSLCFTLLQSSVTGIAEEISLPYSTVASELEDTLVNFTLFSITCLQGESDPRCIMQLLVFFHAIQKTFEPFFVLSGLSTFPITQLFDGVAPYYPIQFTPPPNDVHGITKDGLRNALMSVLCHFGLDELAARDDKDTMHSLSLSLILERLIPIDGDDSEVAHTVNEKFEAVEELSMILFPPGDSNITFSRMNVVMISQISTALTTVHEESSMHVARGRDESGQYKELADLCRTIVSKVAYQVEGVRNKSLWEAFVMESLQSLSPVLTSPTRGQTAIAYIACLAASGGPNTLKNSLEYGLKPLVESLNSQDDDGIETAAYSIGAFFSSCRVSIEKITADGVAMHPHPLEPFSSKVFTELYKIFQDTRRHKMTRIASVRALESVLLVTPTNQFSSDDEEKIGQFMKALATSVLDTAPLHNTIDGNEKAEWRKGCTQTLGCLLGTSFSSSSVKGASAEEESPGNALGIDSIKRLATEKVFPELILSAIKDSKNEDSPRFDRIALALACRTSLRGAARIIESLLRSLNDSIKAKSLDLSTELCAEALSFVFSQGGNTAARAFHELSPPSVTSHDICESLCSAVIGTEKNQKEDLTVDRMGALKLPATEEEREATTQKMDKLFEIISHLLPAYQQWVPQKEISTLVSKASKLVPPLSDTDNIQLCIVLPLLSASLKYYDDSTSEDEPKPSSGTAIDDLVAIGPDLMGFALNAEYDVRARSAAASCLHSSIVQFKPSDVDKCPAYRLVKIAIEPLMLSAVDNLSGGSPGNIESAESYRVFTDCLNMAALVGAAAACRGGSSSATADAIASFLVELACAKKSSIPFSDSGATIDFAGKKDYETIVTIAAASAFGSILSINDGISLWKQRITHKTLKYLQPTIDEYGQGTTKQTAPLGPLAVICHIICCSTIQSTAKSNQSNIARLVTRGLSAGVFYSVAEEDCGGGALVAHADLCSLKKLHLASLLKLLCESSALLSDELGFIATGLLRAYAITVGSNPTGEITSKLLALQALERVPHVHNSRLIMPSVKPAVVSLLGAAMNHPSRLLRQAAVHVRNSWFIIEQKH